ncbi:MAG TPA: class I SAM-dependent methyltransferase [Acidimicrobiia bacterium]
MASAPEQHNRAFWDADADDYQAAHGKGLAGKRAPAWGAWRIPDAEVGALGDVAGLDVLELGCGAAQWSVALRGTGGRAAPARVVGLDLSIGQLRHARHGGVPLVLASGTATPFPAESFDLVFCDHGAMSFCDPGVTVPEVARLLRPGGRLVFCITSFLKWLTDDERGTTTALQRGWFDDHSLVWPEGVAEFQLPYGDWLALFHAHGFEVEALHHLRPPIGAETTYTDFVTYDWSRTWPAEDLWRVRKLT